MFFTMTAAIGAGLTTATFLIQDGPVAAGLAALTVGLASAAFAAALVVRIDRRAGNPEPATDDVPRLTRRRVAGSSPPHRSRPAAARFASAL